MLEPEFIEKDLMEMLRAFSDSVNYLNSSDESLSDPSKRQDTMKTFSQRMISASKHIDDILDHGKLFSESDIELRSLLTNLDKKNQINQQDFQKMTAYSNILQEKFQKSIQDITSSKLGEKVIPEPSERSE